MEAYATGRLLVLQGAEALEPGPFRVPCRYHRSHAKKGMNGLVVPPLLALVYSLTGAHDGLIPAERPEHFPRKRVMTI